MSDRDDGEVGVPAGKSLIAARSYERNLQRVQNTEDVPDSTEIRRRGRPMVADSERHRSIALSISPAVAAMLKEDASENDLSASAYVSRLITTAHFSVRMRDPMEFYASLTVKLSNVGAQVDVIGSRSFQLKDLVRLPIASVQVDRDFGTLWLDAGAVNSDESSIHLYFQWLKVWDGSRYDRHFRRERDITHLTEESVLELIMAGGSSVMPDVF